MATRKKFKFRKIGRIIAPDPNIYWMSTFTGPSYARRRENTSIYDIYVTGRDDSNRSSIGIVSVDINDPLLPVNIQADPIFTFGDIGAFDENGVSYPYLCDFNGKTYMSYVGWMPTVISRFQNHSGLAIEVSPNEFKRVSKAPILPRTNEEYLGTGSACIIAEDSVMKMWYTTFLKWEKQGDSIKHYYLIRYAESSDGKVWKRSEHNCIDFKYDDEFAISRPSVIKLDGKYHMWFSYRGEHYKLGYAFSEDGINWTRDDESAGIETSKEGWDSKALAYSHVFQHEKEVYMIFNGNEYGKEGLGIAKMEIG